MLCCMLSHLPVLTVTNQLVSMLFSQCRFTLGTLWPQHQPLTLVISDLDAIRLDGLLAGLAAVISSVSPANAAAL